MSLTTQRVEFSVNTTNNKEHPKVRAKKNMEALPEAARGLKGMEAHDHEPFAFDMRGPKVMGNATQLIIEGDDQLITEYYDMEEENKNYEEIKNKECSIESTPYYFSEKHLSKLIERVHEAIMNPTEKFECLYEEKKKSHRLKVFLHSYVNSEKNRVNVFRSEFLVPCSPEFFLKFQNNIEEQKKLDAYHEEYKFLETLNASTNVVYLSYKKNILFSKRDFVYLKHFTKIKSESDEKEVWVDASDSVSDEGKFGGPRPNVVRGTNNISGYVVEKVNDNLSFVRTRSEVNFKASVPLLITKTFSASETKKYIDLVVSRIEILRKESK